tara:strand:- start:517 stop:1191 length:675 start_codon:yes stop_codon:yes gene_type:complete
MIEIILDTETTGLSTTEGHRIVEIGCLELNDQIPTQKYFHQILNPERKVSDEAFKIHGYSNDFLKSKKKFSEIVDSFLEFIGEKKLIIHNADFDLSHINNELRLLKKDIIKKDRVIDTLEIARKKFPGASVNLDALCKKFKIDNSKRKKHNALLDCELLAKVYVNLIDQKEPTLDFSNQKNQKNLNKENMLIEEYCKKMVKPTKEELEFHKKFLKNEIKKNFFV